MPVAQIVSCYLDLNGTYFNYKPPKLLIVVWVSRTQIVLSPASMGETLIFFPFYFPIFIKYMAFSYEENASSYW